MTKLYKTDAIVLYSSKYGETDAILTILSPDRGKISCIAKGARKIKSRMRGPTQPFVYGTFLLYQGKSLHTVTQCEYKEPFAGLREDYHKFAMASYAAELTKASLLEGDQQARGIFSLILKTLHALQTEANEIYLRYYEVNMLKELGYEPVLDYCVSCGEKFGKNTGGFSVAAGGIICTSCNNDQSIIEISPPAVAVMRQLLQMDLINITRIRITASVAVELDRVCQQVIEYYLDPKLKSRKIMSELNANMVN